MTLLSGATAYCLLLIKCALPQSQSKIYLCVWKGGGAGQRNGVTSQTCNSMNHQLSCILAVKYSFAGV